MDNEKKHNLDQMRLKALEVLKKRPPLPERNLSESELLRIIHEYQVHKIELELQEEELLRAEIKLEEIKKKYDELFELHNRFILHLIEKKQIKD